MPPSKRIRLKVASPCKVSWDSMTGTDAVRHCGQCNKKVYQLSEMTTDQVEQLLLSPEGTPCVRFYQRKDGAVMTSDCGPGQRRQRRKQAVLGAGLGALSCLGVSLVSPASPAQKGSNQVPSRETATQTEPAEPEVVPAEDVPVQGEPFVLPEPEVDGLEMIMGDIGYIEIDEHPQPSEEG